MSERQWLVVDMAHGRPLWGWLDVEEVTGPLRDDDPCDWVSMYLDKDGKYPFQQFRRSQVINLGLGTKQVANLIGPLIDTQTGKRIQKDADKEAKRQNRDRGFASKLTAIPGGKKA